MNNQFVLYSLTALQAYYSEVIMWRCLRHSNIAPLLGVSEVRPVSLVSVWMEHGNIKSFLENNRKRNRMKYVGRQSPPLCVSPST